MSTILLDICYRIGSWQLVGRDQAGGFRMAFKNSNVVHLRPSGSAPELRCYADADKQPSW